MSEVSPARRVRALVVDDETLARQRLIAMLANEKDVHVVGEADSGSSAVQAIVDQRPDLVFLDVQMPGLDGFGVLRCIAGAHQPTVVFVTAHDEFAIRAFEVHAADYLVKPVTAARLHEAVRRSIERLNSANNQHRTRTMNDLLATVPETPASKARVPIKTGDGTVLVNVGDITWVEADGDHLRVHVGAMVHVLRDTMGELEARLAPFKFVRVHRSALVNVSAVRSVESIAKGDYHLTLRDGARVRSSRSYREQVQALIR